VADKSAIEWTEATWNPTTGCDRISPGCDHCYAMTLAARLKGMGQPRYQNDGDPRTSGPGFGLTLHEDKIEQPFTWRKPRVVFVNSMSDLFHKDVPIEFIGRVFNVMGSCPQHTFQVLTKRPKRMARIVSAYYEATGQEPFPNVWLGTSIESHAYNWRADHLRQVPAAIRFISAEPLIGPLVPKIAGTEEYPIAWWPEGDHDTPCVPYDGLDLHEIDWLIVGGESGAGFRSIDSEWVRDLRDACEYTDTAFFFKQWGGIRPKSGGRELDGRTYDEMPNSLVLREAV
jgi:protein gp37